MMKHVAFLLLALLFVGTVTAQTPVESVFVTNVNSNNFPLMNINIRALDSDNVLMTNISPTDIDIYENNQRVENVTISRGEALPTYTYFIVDNNQYTNLASVDDDFLRSTLDSFITDGFFEDGKDRIALFQTDTSSVNGGEEVLAFVDSGNTFRSALPTVSFTTRLNGVRVYTLEGITYVFNQMIRLADSGQANLSIVYVGAGFDGDGQNRLTEDSQALAEQFVEAGVTFHAIHTRPNDIVSRPVEALVNGTGGKYIPYQGGRDNTIAVQQVYRTIQNQAVTLQVNYRSRNDDSGVRTVSAVPASQPITEAAATGSYEVVLESPVITISEPTSDKIFQREGTVNDDGSFESALQTIPVRARLEWQDNYPRNLLRSELLVDGQPVSTIEDPASQEFIFSLDVSDITETTTRSISVRIRDELGRLESSEQRPLTIEVIKLDRAVLTPQVTEITVVETVVVPGDDTIIVQSPCEVDPTGADCIRTNYLPWLVGLGSLLALIIVTVSFRRQLAALSQGDGNVVTNIVKKVAATIIGGKTRGKKVIAEMRVLMARNMLMEQETIKIYTHTTSFGRDPKAVDVQVYDEDDISSVSGLHCTLQFDPTHQIFYLTDNDSSVGTTINGRPIEPDDPQQLQDGDLIVMGDLARRGAKLQFQIAEDMVGVTAPQEEGIIDEFPIFSTEDESTSFPTIDLNETRSGIAEEPFIEEPYDGRTVLDESMLDGLSGDTLISNDSEQFGFDNSDNKNNDIDDWLSDLS